MEHKISPVELGELSPVKSKRAIPSKVAIGKSSPVKFFPFTKQEFNPQQVSLSPAAVIHPQTRLLLQISGSSAEHLFPTESFSHQFIPPVELSSSAGLFSQSSSFTILSENEEFNIFFLQQQSGIYFPQLEIVIKNITYIMIQAYTHDTIQSHLY